MNILVTGCAGFIGFHTVKFFLDKSKMQIIGIDNLNNYYDVKLKKERLKNLKKKNFIFINGDIKDKKKLEKIFKSNNIKYVIHLAAQAGVRYSINNPQTYFDNNILGFFNIIDLSKKYKIKHFIYASSSSVYGDSINFPLDETENTDRPLSFYAASKKCNEVMAYSYSNIYGLRSTGLRFFTVYGPMGRPDMSLYKFTDSIFRSKKIQLYNYGNHIRDFTYIDDITVAIFKLINRPPKQKVPHSIYNVGSDNPKSLKYYLKIIEKNCNKDAKVGYLGLQKGDVHKTHAGIDQLRSYIDYHPKTKIENGIKYFVKWYKKNLNIK